MALSSQAVSSAQPIEIKRVLNVSSVGMFPLSDSVRSDSAGEKKADGWLGRVAVRGRDESEGRPPVTRRSEGAGNGCST